MQERPKLNQLEKIGGHADLEVLMCGPPRPGTVVAFLGPLGSGKTTMLERYLNERRRSHLKAGVKEHDLEKNLVYIAFEEIQKVAQKEPLWKTPQGVTLEDRSPWQYDRETVLFYRVIMLALQRGCEVVIEVSGLLRRGNIALEKMFHLLQEKSTAIFLLGDHTMVHDTFKTRLRMQRTCPDNPAQKIEIMSGEEQCSSHIPLEELYASRGSGTEMWLFSHRFQCYLFFFLQELLRDFRLLKQLDFLLNIYFNVFDFYYGSPVKNYNTESFMQCLMEAWEVPVHFPLSEEDMDEVMKMIQRRLDVCKVSSPEMFARPEKRNKFMKEFFLPIYWHEMGALPGQYACYINTPIPKEYIPFYDFAHISFLFNFIRILDQEGKLSQLAEIRKKIS